jgi:hypothetical protein
VSRIFSSILFGLALSLGVGAPAPAVAADSPSAQAPSGKVTLSMPVVYATESHSRVDPKLKSVVRYLKHLRYTGFELLDSHRVQVAPKGRQSFNIVGGRKVVIDLLNRDAKRARVRVQIEAGKGRKVLDTTMYLNRNSTVIVAGPRHKDGILVLPLTARY